jgi:predicted methyltransferase
MESKRIKTKELIHIIEYGTLSREIRDEIVEKLRQLEDFKKIVYQTIDPIVQMYELLYELTDEEE